MRALLLILLLILLALQYQLWLAPGGMREVWRLERELAAQREENAVLAARNDALAAEVADLKEGLEAIEERARTELGMVREDETFHQVVRPTAGEAGDGS